MKITIVTGPFSCLPPVGYGAVEKIWASLGAEFSKRGHEVVFVCKRDGRGGSGHQGGRIELRGFARTGNLTTDIALDFFYSANAVLRIPKSDIVVLNAFWLPYLCFLAKRNFRKSVYNVARIPKGQFAFAQLVDRLACVSSAVKEALLEQSPRRQHQVRVIGNPIDSHTFQVRPRAADSAAPTICYAGRIHPEKGLDLLVRAMRYLRRTVSNAQLLLIGPWKVEDGGGGPQYVSQLQQAADGLPFEVRGPVSQPAQLADAIAGCSAFCYPSVAEYGEAFGVGPLEAMAIGRPVVVSGLKCFSDFIIDGDTGLVFDHRCEQPHIALAEKLEQILLDDNLSNRLAIRGSEVAHARFSTEAIADQYLADFDAMLQGSLQPSVS